MNWKRPQDELPEKNKPVFLRIIRNEEKLFRFLTSGTEYEVGKYDADGYFSTGEKWHKYYPTTSGRYKSDDGHVITHWCEIEEPA